jgi:hypothetical protein
VELLPKLGVWFPGRTGRFAPAITDVQMWFSCDSVLPGKHLQTGGRIGTDLTRHLLPGNAAIDAWYRILEDLDTDGVNFGSLAV